MKVHGRYSYADLADIFEETDVLVAPSIWYETFGYTVLEALSFGVPVIVSNTVGAKDIIPEGCGIILEDMNETLEETLGGLTKDQLVQMNQNIVALATIRTVPQMNAEIVDKCYCGNNAMYPSD